MLSVFGGILVADLVVDSFLSVNQSLYSYPTPNLSFSCRGADTVTLTYTFLADPNTIPVIPVDRTNPNQLKPKSSFLSTWQKLVVPCTSTDLITSLTGTQRILFWPTSAVATAELAASEQKRSFARVFTSLQSTMTNILSLCVAVNGSDRLQINTPQPWPFTGVSTWLDNLFVSQCWLHHIS